MRKPVHGSDATIETPEVEDFQGKYLAVILFKLVLNCSDLDQLDAEEREALTDHMVELLTADML